MHIPTIDELKKALHLKERIEGLQKELSSIFGKTSHSVLTMVDSGIKNATVKIRKMSKKGRAAITAAQKARWAKVKGAKVKSKPAAAKEKPAKKKGKMSAAGRANIVAAQKKRWAKVKAGKAGKKA